MALHYAKVNGVRIAYRVPHIGRHFTQGGRIDGSTHIEVGLDVSDFDYACDVILFSEFTDSAALKAYASHSEHLRVHEELGRLQGSRFQVDYPIKQETSA